MTSICGRPTSRARFFFIGPSLVPDGQIGANKLSRMPSDLNNRLDQFFWVGLYSWVVLARETSLRAIPEQKKLKASPISSRCLALARRSAGSVAS